jgi:hypothetical protein
VTIIAKFASICPCCNVRITPGTKVEWSSSTQTAPKARAAVTTATVSSLVAALLADETSGPTPDSAPLPITAGRSRTAT